MAKPHQRRWSRVIAAACIALVLVAIALGVGLGVGLAKRAQNAASSTAVCTPPGSGAPIELSATPPRNTSRRIGEAFISFAFEFASFASFAGNTSTPNEYSNNLLNALGNLTGTKPYVRVGGTSADLAVLDTSLPNATTHRENSDLPAGQGPDQVLHYSDIYFQSFTTWPDTKYIYGFDMAYIVSSDADVGYASLNSTVPLICEALADGRFLYWEYGNEPNLYPTATHAYVDSNDWTDQRYLSEWENGTSIIKQRLQQDARCADLAGASFGFVAPSLWTPMQHSTMTLDKLWNEGLSGTGLVRMVSMHRYLTSNNTAGLTLDNTLLNHTLVEHNLADLVAQYGALGDTAPPLMLGESNSISNMGISNVTDTLAGGLWAMDWALWCAAQNVSRVHFQQGLGFFYNAWDPIDTHNIWAGTKPPYYGHLAAATALGESTASRVQVLAHDLRSDTDSAYSVYANGTLARVAVLNLRPYRTGSRGAQTYTFAVPNDAAFHSVSAHRLLGPSSDALGGVQWDGQQYDITSNGLPTATNNVTTGEQFLVCNGTVSVTLDDSSAVVLQFSST